MSIEEARKEEVVVIDWVNLTKEEQKEFDCFDPVEAKFMDFFRYRGRTYCLDDFTALPEQLAAELPGWQGYLADSYFSGVLFMEDDNGDHFAATYYC